jgi:hypothetical protein
MGLDCTYQALPGGCELLERAQRDAGFGELLSLVPWRAERLERWRRDGGVSAEFAEEVRLLCQRHPGLEQRCHTVDRDWDALHYLLSEARRAGSGDDWSGNLIRGAGVIAEHLRAGQGVPLRYSGPETVKALFERLERVSEAELRQSYEPERMEERAVYKFWANRADAQTWPLLWERFEGLRAFFRQVADKGEGVLVLLD